MFKKLILGIALALAASVAIAPIALAAADHSPNGNKGFVQISDGASPSHPGNDPHVNCSFYVDFYDYGKTSGPSDVNFSLQAPTSGDGYSLSVLSGNLHPSIGGADNGLDASIQYKLGFTGTPQAQQGYHVKLTVATPDSNQHAKKSKVFWVKPCSTVTTASAITNTQGSNTVQSVDRLPNTGVNALQALLLSGVASVFGFVFHRRFIA